MKRLLPTFIGSLLVAASPASDQAKPWDRVSFEVPTEVARAAVTAEGGEALTMLTLKLGDTTMHVPAEELEAIAEPKLETAQLLFGEGYYGPVEEGEEPIPHYLIEMEYGSPTEFGLPTTVRFLFHSGAYQERIVLTPTSPNTWGESRKAPGEEPIDTGTITRPPPAPRSGPIPGAGEPEEVPLAPDEPENP